jgi:serine protease
VAARHIVGAVDGRSERPARGAPAEARHGPPRRRPYLLVLALLGFWLGMPCVAPAAGKAPNDPLFKYQWNLRAIGIPAAWEVTRGAGATVAVLDTGVAYRNARGRRRAPEFARTRFVAGYDFVDDDRFPDDVPPPGSTKSHGTLMTGLIAQAAGNALGGAGVAPGVTVMPIRVLEPDLNGTARAIARGLRFAADHGADVANVSISGPKRSRVLQDAVAYAVGKGVTVVAASGNTGQDAVGWPAADPNVIAVGAVDQNLTRASYSTYGEELDLVAPAGTGERTDTGSGPSDGVVAQTLKGDASTFCFCFSASTSAAAAQVSGVAALLVASGRATTPTSVRMALMSSARDLGARGADPEYGAGLVQAARALGVAAGAAPAAAAKPAVRVPDAGVSGGSGVSAGLVAGAVIAACAAVGAATIAVRRRRRKPMD